MQGSNPDPCRVNQFPFPYGSLLQITSTHSSLIYADLFFIRSTHFRQLSSAPIHFGNPEISMPIFS